MHDMRPIDRVLEQLEDYTQRGDEYRAPCPAHDGDSPDALSVKEADNGDVLVHCHSEGCSAEEIADALDLEIGDLFSKNGKASKPVTLVTKEKQPVEGRTADELPGEHYWTFEDENGETIYIQEHKGPYYRRVGENEEGEPLWVLKLEDVEPTLFELPNLLRGVAAGEMIVHTEGCKDVKTAMEELGVVATTSGSATSWKSEFAEHYRGAKEVVIIPDNDEEGATYAAKVAQDLLGIARSVKVVELPGLPEKGDLSDWITDGHSAEEFFALIEATEALDPGQAWPEEPQPLEIDLPPVEGFDSSLLPTPLRDWVFDVAQRMDNAPPDFTAAAAIVQAAALLGRKVGIYPKRHDDWMVIPNLWGGLVGPPASMKTPALEQVIKPTKRLAAKTAEDHVQAAKKHALDMMIVAAEHAALKKKLESKAREVADGKATRSEMEAIREKLEALEEPGPPTQKRYLTNDATIEKIAEILAVNPDGILYYRDELVGWLRGLDKAGRESDRAFYLEAWNGNGAHEVDRIGRGSIHVPAICISVLGGIQPGPLLKYVGDALEEAEKADGLLQRFQVLVYPDLCRFDPVDRSPNRKARNLAYDVFKKLADLGAEEFGASPEHDDDVPCVRFSDAAQEVFDAWRSEVEPRYRSGQYPAAIEAHLLKYRSLFASLALIFEAVDFVGGASGGEKSVEVSYGPSWGETTEEV